LNQAVVAGYSNALEVASGIALGGFVIAVLAIRRPPTVAVSDALAGAA
jgi:hypothetical protein